jgi:hypothetical protein
VAKFEIPCDLCVPSIVLIIPTVRSSGDGLTDRNCSEFLGFQTRNQPDNDVSNLGLFNTVLK